MSRSLGIIGLGTIVAIAIAGAVAWKFTLGTSLADPATASLGELARWLIVDLANHPTATQQILVDRLQAESLADDDRSQDLADAAKMLPPQYSRRILANAELLKRVWFLRRVNEYAACEIEKRPAFLDAQLQTLFRWIEIEASLNGRQATDDPSAEVASVGLFYEQTRVWLKHESPSQNRLAETTLRDALLRFLATHSVSELSDANQSALALLVAKQLLTENGAQSLAIGDDRKEREQLQFNCKRLLFWWFREQAIEFAALPAEAETQRAFIAEQLASVRKSGLMELLLPTATSASSSTQLDSLIQAANGLGWARVVNEWVAAAPEHERETLTRFRDAIQSHLLAQQVRSLWSWPSTSDPAPKRE